jgi:uncharacterized protein YjeT (DUF2065 family)
MEDDDLPPRPLREAPQQTEGFARSLGELAGGSLWIGLFLVVAGVILYFFMRTTY